MVFALRHYADLKCDQKAPVTSKYKTNLFCHEQEILDTTFGEQNPLWNILIPDTLVRVTVYLRN